MEGTRKRKLVCEIQVRWERFEERAEIMRTSKTQVSESHNKAMTS